MLVRIAPARRSISRYAPYPPNDDSTTVHATAHQNVGSAGGRSCPVVAASASTAAAAAPVCDDEPVDRRRPGAPPPLEQRARRQRHRPGGREQERPRRRRAGPEVAGDDEPDPGETHCEPPALPDGRPVRPGRGDEQRLCRGDQRCGTRRHTQLDPGHHALEVGDLDQQTEHGVPPDVTPRDPRAAYGRDQPEHRRRAEEAPGQQRRRGRGLRYRAGRRRIPSSTARPVPRRARRPFLVDPCPAGNHTGRYTRSAPGGGLP